MHLLQIVIIILAHFLGNGEGTESALASPDNSLPVQNDYTLLKTKCRLFLVIIPKDSEGSVIVGKGSATIIADDDPLASFVGEEIANGVFVERVCEPLEQPQAVYDI